ncbi:MAG TPA: response regulator [Candidatus Acidoferrum sp.]|nr:response regulator [Candidatus Acidoferrum sp.]
MKRLLVVEDHPWILRTLCDSLRCDATHIESATTLRSARQRVLADDPYDLVICEQHLSDGNGLEFLGYLRWHEKIDVPFLLITRNDQVTADYDSDFGVITKPFETIELLASVHRLLRAQARGIIARQVPFAGTAD